MVVNSEAICLQSGRLVILCCFQLGNLGGFCLKPCWLFRLSENWDSGDLKAWFALKEYGFKFSLVEKQTAQITRVSLLVGLVVSPCCTAWLVILLSVNQWPLLKAGAACFGKAYAGKRPQAQLLTAHWLLCYYPEKEEGWSYQTADGVCGQSVFIYKRSRGWWGLVCGVPGSKCIFKG